MRKNFSIRLSSVAALVMFAACESGPQAPGADAGMLAVNAAEGQAPAASASAPSDANTIKLALKYVSYVDESGKPVISEDATRQIVSRVNELFAPCAVSFVLEKYEAVRPADVGLEMGMSSMSTIDSIRARFEEPNGLLVVNTGNWSDSLGPANAWTAMPGSGPYGAVLEAVVADNANIVAHELGHYLNLDHVSDTANLLNPVIYDSSRALSESQCKTVRDAAADYWQPMVR